MKTPENERVKPVELQERKKEKEKKEEIENNITHNSILLN